MPIPVRRALAAAVALATATAVPLASPVAAAAPKHAPFTLTVLHNNDGESKLLHAPGQPDFGGAARFKTLVDKLRSHERKGPHGRKGRGKRGSIVLSSGDNFLAGPEFAASLEKGVPFYDSIAFKAIGYDASAIGNHEFDFGPDVLADFIEGVGRATPFVSANLRMDREPRLAELVKKGVITTRTVVKERGERIGIVGATTPRLRSISSPRNVEVLENVAELVQAEADGLTRRGVNKIIMISHLQSIGEDAQLAPMLRDIDVMIAGGGDELLASDDARLVPGDEISTDPDTGEKLRYPLFAKDADGADVPIVTTAGDYKYVGRLVVKFDRRGRVTGVDRSSGPVRVSGVAPDRVAPDSRVTSSVVEPVKEFTDALAENVIATSEVALEGRRDPGVRTQETNLGDLLADSLLETGRARAGEFGVTPPDVALQNGGGIRNNSLIPAGDLTELETFGIAPFSNFVSVVPDIPRDQFKEILENAVSGIPAADGRFAQVAGFKFTYDPSGTAQEVDDDGNILTTGTRIRSVTLDDGTQLVADGEVVDGAPVSVATNDFSARGGDQYPFRGADFTSVGVTYQQALATYLSDTLGGRVTAADYPEGGSGRITTHDPLPFPRDHGIIQIPRVSE